VASLNVSAAGAVVLYEAYRQRRKGVEETPAQERATPKVRKGLGS